MHRLYVGDAFGWETDYTAKTAIAQLRQENIISVHKCPKAQLLKNESLRLLPNALKFLGYIPFLNIIAGTVAITYSESSPEYGPCHTSKWRGRGVAMILAGPLLLVVDSIKYIYDLSIANQYNQEHPDLIQAFNTAHEHTIAHWPGHPVRCEKW